MFIVFHPSPFFGTSEKVTSILKQWSVFWFEQKMSPQKPRGVEGLAPSEMFRGMFQAK